MKFITIVMMCILVSVAYGIVHDNITARLCIEYFTVGHPIIIPTEDPTTIALLWGVIATWWVGAALGILVAASARLGRLPQVEPRQILKPLLRVIVGTGCFAVLAGIAGYTAARLGWVYLVPELANRIPPERHIWFVVDLWMHGASYLGGAIGGISICISLRRLRRTLASESNSNGIA